LGDFFNATGDWVNDRINGPGTAKRMHEEQAKFRGKLWNGIFGVGSASAAEALPVRMDTTASSDIANKIGAAVKDALVGIGVNLDGKKVGEIVANRIADSLNRPMSGANGADLRISPLMPGMAGGFP
jgi:hypothetical protein